MIRTLDSPSWVAWREVRVFGTLSANAIEAVGAPRLKLNRIATGLELPVQVTHAGDSSGRLFVVEQKGRIRIIRKRRWAQQWRATQPDQRHTLPGYLGAYQLLRGAGADRYSLSPAYAAKQHFYVSYTNVDGTTVISRFKPLTTRTEPTRTAKMLC